MDRSKIAAALPGVEFVSRPSELEGADAELVVVDLSRPGVLEALAAVRATRILGYASHVDRATLDAARAGGVEAMARSEFFRRLPFDET